MESIPIDMWNELKETIIELRDNGGMGTQHVVCKFLVTLMEVQEHNYKVDKIIHAKNYEKR